MAHGLCITGPLGAGKTTTLIRLLINGGDVATTDNTQLVINEIGEAKVDVARLTEKLGGRANVASLLAGCLGCDNAVAFDALVAANTQRELLVVEPTGVADAREIKAITDQHGLAWSCLTIVNPVTFRRNVVEGLLAAQLSVATAVMISRPDKLEPELEADMLAFIARYAPGAPIYRAKADGNLPFSLADLLADTQENGADHSPTEPHAHDEHCHHDHGAHGSHGHVSVAFTLRPEVTLLRLQQLVSQHRNIVRAKGIVEGRWFDVVGPEVNVGEAAIGEPHAVLIADGRINAWLFAGLRAEQPDLPSKKALMTKGGHHLKDVLAAIEYHATSYPHPVGPDNLPLLGVDNDVAVYLSQTEGVPYPYKVLSLRSRMAYYMQLADVLAAAETAGRYNVSPSRLARELLEIGAALAWNAKKKADLLTEALISEIASRRPATMAIRGLSTLDSLNLHLLPDDNQGPTTPTAIVPVVQFGLDNEGLDTRLALAAMEHALALAAGYPLWEARWLDAIDQVATSV